MKKPDTLALKLTEDEAAAVRAALLLTAVSFCKSGSEEERTEAARMDVIRDRLARSIKKTFPAQA